MDINTQQSFEALSERAVAVVVDPIQSVKGKVTEFKTLIVKNVHTCTLDILLFVAESLSDCNDICDVHENAEMFLS